MKRLVRILLGIVVATVALALLGLGWLMLRYPIQRPAPAERIAATPERLARGEYLVQHVTGCLHCHSEAMVDRFGAPPRPGTLGQGGFVFTHALGVPGRLSAQNITPDRETGIGAWTDGEIVRAVREGVSRDGHALFPMMPYKAFRLLSDDDAQAIVVYLRTLPAIRHAVPARELDFPLNLIVRTIPEPLSEPARAPSSARDHIAYGKYLVTIAGCAECHSPHDAQNKPIPEGGLSGGWEMRGPWGRAVTANLTPHSSTFVGRAPKEAFIGRFKSFEDMEGDNAPPADPHRNTPMPWTALAGMTEDDLGAIYDYLRTLPPNPRSVVTFPDAAPRAQLP